ncbi:MAG: SDR family oxidoreductase [Pirellulales bacterium]|nr:SDR family oxidoreductase [Pirellulales bacterium]
MATSNEFKDKTALVTGGSRGIGRATTLRLAAEGARVAINFVSREQEARQTLDEVEQAGGTGVLVQGDVSQPESAAAMVAATREALGPIDFLAHCAGMAVVESADQTSWESWKRTMEVNLDGTFNMIFAVKDEMVERQFGRIVVVSSTAALRARPALIAYSASKAGMISLARSCGEAWAHHNVRVNCLLPGVTETEMPRKSMTPESLEAMIEATPMRRIGQPEEMASIIRFLLSEESSYMTGQSVAASGGRVLLPG